MDSSIRPSFYLGNQEVHVYNDENYKKLYLQETVLDIKDPETPDVLLHISQKELKDAVFAIKRKDSWFDFIASIKTWWALRGGGTRDFAFLRKFGEIRASESEESVESFAELALKVGGFASKHIQKLPGYERENATIRSGNNSELSRFSPIQTQDAKRVDDYRGDPAFTPLRRAVTHPTRAQEESLTGPQQQPIKPTAGQAAAAAAGGSGGKVGGSEEHGTEMSGEQRTEDSDVFEASGEEVLTFHQETISRKAPFKRAPESFLSKVEQRPASSSSAKGPLTREQMEANVAEAKQWVQDKEAAAQAEAAAKARAAQLDAAAKKLESDAAGLFSDSEVERGTFFRESEKAVKEVAEALKKKEQELAAFTAQLDEKFKEFESGAKKLDDETQAMKGKFLREAVESKEKDARAQLSQEQEAEMSGVRTAYLERGASIAVKAEQEKQLKQLKQLKDFQSALSKGDIPKLINKGIGIGWFRADSYVPLPESLRTSLENIRTGRETGSESVQKALKGLRDALMVDLEKRSEESSGVGDNEEIIPEIRSALSQIASIAKGV